MPRRRNKARSGAVRQEQFERSMAGMNYEMAGKVAQSMAKYHTMKVEPLERRVRTIELMFGIALVRWCYWKVADAYHAIYMKFSEPIPEEESPEPDAVTSLLEPMPDPVEEEIKQAVQRVEYPH